MVGCTNSGHPFTKEIVFPGDFTRIRKEFTGIQNSGPESASKSRTYQITESMRQSSIIIYWRCGLKEEERHCHQHHCHVMGMDVMVWWWRWSYPAAMVANQLSFINLQLYHGLSISMTNHCFWSTNIIGKVLIFYIMNGVIALLWNGCYHSPAIWCPTEVDETNVHIIQL